MGVAYPVDRYVRSYEAVPPWRYYALTAWAGFRGGVSLAAALAIPLAAGGHAFPHRSLLIFLTFAVILATLVGQGATLPLVARRLDLHDDDSEIREHDHAMTEATRYSLGRLAERARAGRVDADAADDLRKRYERQQLADDVDPGVRNFHRAELDLLADQHVALVAMRNRGQIENTTFRHLETHLDFKRLQLEAEVTRGDAVDGGV
jgi:CPA1 family monovalent cation:H+ antiporter